MSIAAALASLLEAVDNDRRARCAALLDAADTAVRARLAAAGAANRRRLRAALKAERLRARAKIAAAEAGLQAAQRRARQAHAALSLAQASALLPGALQAIWQDPTRRRDWLDAALRRAATLLPRQDWRCRHPATLAAGELDAWRNRAAQLGVVGLRCEPDAGIDAGIAIDCGEATLDATSAGLLAELGLVEGRLLHFLETV